MKTNPDLLRPRWSKVLSDLWGDKTRTILVVASIAAGVFAVGMIISAFMIMREDINSNYAAANPANIEIWTTPFQEDFIRIINKMPGVKDVEGRRFIRIRARRGDEQWQSLALIGFSDIENDLINKLTTMDGSQNPSRDEAVISENLMRASGFRIGDRIEIELPDGSRHRLTVSGLVSDQTNNRPDPEVSSQVLVTMHTLHVMGAGDYFDRLLVTIEGDGSNLDVIEQVAVRVEDKFESHNMPVFRREEAISSEHPMSDTLLAVMGVLGALGVLITILSGSLIINTLNALLTQQLRQIGVMKLVGGRSLQILGMYLSLIMAYSLIAILIAVPLGSIAGYRLASFITREMGGTISGFRFIPLAVLSQVLIAILIPVGAGFFPVRTGARTNVRRAISNYRPEGRSASGGLLVRSSRWLRWISRPIMLSIRNTFRKKSRLILTIFTLTVAGAVFIAVFNVRSSMNHLMDQLMQHFLGDVNVSFNQPYKTSRVERDLLTVPGVIGVEGWGGARGDILDENNEVVTSITFIAPPQDTQLLDPDIIAGRWLAPGEEKAMVVSDTIYNLYPDLQPGDTLIVEIPGTREEAWEVVGVYRYIDMFGDPMAYAPFDTISRKVNLPDQANSFRLITSVHGKDGLRDLIRRIESRMDERGYNVRLLEAGDLMRENVSFAVNVLVIFLLIMALLTAFVGSIGLTGTMSINVLERTREIGVMRTIGAVDFVIMKTVIIEALFIGLITWLLAIGLSFPISSALLNIIGQAMSGSTLTLTITPHGFLVWLGVVIALSIIASIMPARNAARLTINEVLSYE